MKSWLWRVCLGGIARQVMIYTHPLNKDGLGVQCPVDHLLIRCSAAKSNP